MISSKFILTQMVINLPTGSSRLGRQWSGLACQGAGSCSSSTISLQYWAEETARTGKYLPANSFSKVLTMA